MKFVRVLFFCKEKSEEQLSIIEGRNKISSRVSGA